MPDALSTSRSLHLFTEGFLPGWAGLAVFAAATWFVLYQLRKEFSGMPVRRHLRVALPVLRTAIVGLLAWLLCRPVLKVIHRDTYRPTLLVLLDETESMSTRETFPSLHRKIDLLELLDDRAIEGRNNIGSVIARAADSPIRLLSSVGERLGTGLADTEQGLPMDPESLERVRRLASDIPASMMQLNAARSRPTDTIPEDLQGAVDTLAQSRRDLDATMKAIASDADVVSREAPRHVDLLRGYIARLSEAAGAARQLQADAEAVQDRLDAALLPEEELAAARDMVLSRGAIARRVTTYISSRAQRFYTVRPGSAPSFGDCLGALLQESMTGDAHAAVLVSDGSTPPTARTRDMLAAMRRTGIPVHAVIVGQDGVEPSDAGLVAVDVPSVLLRGVKTPVRALVKYALADGRRATLQVRAAQTVLGTVDITGTEPGTRPVEFMVVMPEPGRHQLVVELVVEGGDDFEGNERHVRTIDVLARPARTVLLAGELSADAAAYAAAAQLVDFVDVTVLLDAKEIGTVETGSEADMFPAQRDDWEGTTAVVLTGPVPPELTTPGDDDGRATPRATPVEELLAAVEGGLRVCIQETGKGGRKPSWAEVFGLTTRNVDGMSSIRPAGGLRPELRRLGRNKPESDALWKNLPAAAGCTVVDDGMPLLQCEEGPVVAVIPRGAGHIVYCGIRDLGQLRTPDTSVTVNRLIAGLLALTIRPLAGDNPRFVIFPPQPVHGSELVARGMPGTTLQVVDGLEPAGTPDRFRVTDAEQIGLTVEGESVNRLVQLPLGPEAFALAARASRLEQVTEATGGMLVKAADPASLPPLNTAPPTSSLTCVDTYVLWKGWWPLPWIALLASAEYLLRRRAGRVM